MKVPTRDKKRDKQLISDYQSDIKMYILNGKYKISSTRIYQILKHYKIPRNRKTKKND